MMATRPKASFRSRSSEMGLVATTLLLNLALAWLTGSLLATSWLRRDGSAWSVSTASWLRCRMWPALTLALLAQCALLWLEAAVMTELPLMQAFANIGNVIKTTHFGVGAMLGAIATVCLALAVLFQRALIATTALLLLFFSRSMLSHAASDGDVSWTIGIDWLHMLSVSAWTGTVLVAAVLNLTGGKGVSPQAAYITAMSRTATFALAGVLVSGLLNAWQRVAAVPDWLGSAYGIVLLAKIALVLLAAGLGGVNRFLVLPKLSHEASAATRFNAIIRSEAVILTGVLLLAAVLAATPPPGTA
jgi:putative copper resistance protein D